MGHADGRVDVFALASDLAVWTLSRIGTTWGSAWQSLGGQLKGGAVTPLIESNDDVTVFSDVGIQEGDPRQQRCGC